MKKAIITIGLVMLCILKTYSQLSLNSGGDVGIGITTMHGKLHIRNSADGSDEWSGLRFIPATSATSGIDSYHKLWGYRKSGLWLAGSANGSYSPKSNILLKEEGIYFATSNGTTNPESGIKVAILNNGNVGIGITDPGSYKLNVYGYAMFTPNPSYNYRLIVDFSGFYGTPCLRPNLCNNGNIGTSDHYYAQMWSAYYGTGSDARQKENVKEIKNALDIVLKLTGVRYDLKKQYAYVDTLIKDSKLLEKAEEQRKNKVGFLAQDVYKVLPEVVLYDDIKDIYGIDYSKVVPVLVNAIKEQQATIDTLKSEIENLKLGTRLKSAQVSIGIEDAGFQIDKPYLEQNAPNPFSISTTINFYIPQSSQTALICIYDLQGLQKKVYSINMKGKSNIIINGNELQAGMYLYTLIVNGKEIDTKKMILTE